MFTFYTTFRVISLHWATIR